MSKLINTEAEATRAHITTETLVLRNQIETTAQANEAHVDAQHLITRDHITSESSRITVHLELERQMDTIRQEQELRTRILSTLWFPEMNARENNIQEVAEETVKWIFGEGNQNPEAESAYSDFHPEEARRDPAPKHYSQFREWLEGDDHVFWISGKPGSGKSTLMKFLVEDRRTKDYLSKWKPDVTICRYFLIETCVNPLQRELRGCLRALLHQTLTSKPYILDLLLQQRPRLEAKHSEHDWSGKELQDVLMETLHLHGSPFCIFIDGLDEIAVGSDDRESIIELIEELGQLSNVKICVSSRPENIFKQSLGSSLYPFLQTEELNESAIELYIWKRLAPFKASFPADPETYRNVASDLVRKASGVFLWVRLATKSIVDGTRNGDSWKTLRKRIDELEPDLERLFEQMWERQNANKHLYKEETARLLWYALHSSGAFEEVNTPLGYILGTHADLSSNILPYLNTNTTPIPGATAVFKEYEKWLSARSAGLLEIYKRETQNGNPSTDSLLLHGVQLIHRSAREFLLDTKAGHNILLADRGSIRERLLYTLKTRKQISCYLATDQWFPSYYMKLIFGFVTEGYMTPQEETKEFLSFKNLLQPRDPAVYTDFSFLETAARYGSASFLSQQGEALELLSYQEKSMILLETCLSGNYIHLESFRTSVPLRVEHQVAKTPTIHADKVAERSTERFRDTIRWLMCNGADPNAKLRVCDQSHQVTSLTPYYAFMMASIWNLIGRSSYFQSAFSVCFSEFQHYQINWDLPFYFSPITDHGAYFYPHPGNYKHFQIGFTSIFMISSRWLGEFLNRVNPFITTEQKELEITRELANDNFNVQCIAIRLRDRSRRDKDQGFRPPSPDKIQERQQFEAVIGRGYLRWLYGLPDEHEDMNGLVTRNEKALYDPGYKPSGWRL